MGKPEITHNDRKTIKKIQSILFKIDNKMPIFFNITQFQNMGLVKGRNQYYIDAAGNKQRLKTNWFLTEKGKRTLNAVL